MNAAHGVLAQSFATRSEKGGEKKTPVSVIWGSVCVQRGSYSHLGHIFLMKCVTLIFVFFVASFQAAPTNETEEPRTISCHCDGPRCAAQNETCQTKQGGKCFRAIEMLPSKTLQHFSHGCAEEYEFLMDLVQHHDVRSIHFCNDTDLCNKLTPPKANDFALTVLLYFISVLISILLIFTLVRVARKVHHRVSQRSVAKDLTLTRCIGGGRFGKVWLAKWNGEVVAVKVFEPSEKEFWSWEIEICDYRHMHHENILKFEGKSSEIHKRMFLITEYHENGSLHDYLNSKILDSYSLKVICSSIANGIAHLHNETKGLWNKPAIAHRNIKSKNILVKRNGECCVADFTLAVTFTTNPDRLKMAPNAGLRDGTPRYMAPEVLTGTLNQRSFEDFKMADIYSIALVLWETCRRCATFEVEPYKLPYHEAIENEDPDYMEMSRIVPNIRPTIPARWNGNPVLSELSTIMVKCWDRDPTKRPTAIEIRDLVSNIKNN